jgi:hypothetical protein
MMRAEAALIFAFSPREKEETPCSPLCAIFGQNPGRLTQSGEAATTIEVHLG